MHTSENDKPVDLDQLSRPHKRGCLPSFSVVRLYLKADLMRYHGSGRMKFWRHFLFTPGYQYTVWMRLTGWAILRPATRYTIGIILKMLLSRCRYKYGIAIPEYTDIGPGLLINRFNGIFMNGDVIIGANFNIGQLTLLGQTNRGVRAGSPIIGDRAFVGVGACVVGRVRIGNGAVVGVNAVVTRDVEDNAVVAGNPAKVLSTNGSEGYVNRIVPDDILAACYAARSKAEAKHRKPNKTI